MRILHVIPQFPYVGGRTVVGGHASCMLSLALAQYQAGEKVTILSYIEGCCGPREIDNGPTAYSLFAHAQTRTVRFGLRLCRAAVDWVTAHREEFDVVHVHSGFADYYMVSGRIKSRVGLPTLHTLYCPIAPTGRWRLPLVRRAIRGWANRLDWRGAVSVNTANSITQYGLRNVEVIRPAVDRERFSHPAEGNAARRELGIGESDLVVLFVGNAKPQKNAIGMLRAVHRIRADFPELKVVITTELKHTSADADLARLSREVRDLGLESCLVQLGIVTNMPALMQACDILVAPFLDSFGPSDYFMAALEAMASGKPVVVSNVGGMPEVVSNDVGRLVDPHDIESIASGMRELLADRQFRLRAGERARSYVEQHFDPATIMSTQQAVYRRF